MSCSAKYCTMSLRSGSPCTRTSSPRSIWVCTTAADLGAHRAPRSRPRRAARRAGRRAPGAARRSAGTSRWWSSAAAAGASRARCAARRVGVAPVRARSASVTRRDALPGRRRRARSARPRGPPAAAVDAQLAGDRRRGRRARPRASSDELVELLPGEGEPARRSAGRGRAPGATSSGTCSSEQDAATSTRSARPSSVPRVPRAARQVGAPDVAAVDDARDEPLAGQPADRGEAGRGSPRRAR